MEFEELMMRWASLAIDDLTPAEHKQRATVYERQVKRYEELSKDAKRLAKVHRVLAEKKSQMSKKK